MPRHEITDSYSDPITVAPGQDVQNAGRYLLYVSFIDPASDDDAYEIQPGKGLEVKSATSMRVRSASRIGGTIKVLGGR
ncbi:MAG: hypothetical protein ACK5LJ_05095 [Paracoccus sp. (in: a-proteobacteria)]